MRADEFPIDLLLLQLDDYNIFDDKEPLKQDKFLDNPSSPEDGANLGGYVSPPSGYKSPPSGYISPQSGFKSPPSGYKSHESGFKSPPSGYKSPQSGFKSPPSGYKSPQSGYKSPPCGYKSPPSGYQSPQSGFMCPPPGGQISPAALLSLSTSPATSTTKPKIPRHKRQSHINAEHRRRCKIQTGFEDLQRLVPAITDNKMTGRESKSGMLYKAADYCRKLRNESKDLNKEAELLRAEIKALTGEISGYQQNLPEAGIAVAKPSNTEQLQKMFKDYIQSRTFQNWKFWIFGMFIEPLWETFKSAVSVTNLDEFTQSTLMWVQQHCSLIQLRPAMMNLLLQLSTKTSVMSKPDCLPEEAMQRTMEAAGFPMDTNQASTSVTTTSPVSQPSLSTASVDLSDLSQLQFDIDMSNLQIQNYDMNLSSLMDTSADNAMATSTTTYAASKSMS